MFWLLSKCADKILQNGSHVFSNYMLFHLQRHCHHLMAPKQIALSMNQMYNNTWKINNILVNHDQEQECGLVLSRGPTIPIFRNRFLMMPILTEEPVPPVPGGSNLLLKMGSETGACKLTTYKKREMQHVGC